MKKTHYSIGDEVTINNISWTINNIRHRFGTLLSYDMDRSDGKDESFTIEAGSLETLMEIENE